mmetsp:Transcript_17571/g.31541  ORF Transcript_17571/g.31541 Transcript_17571/m.31541 type:complete len:353 (-) Transcript_17571:55-1113(-)
MNERSFCRIIGVTLETRPDCINHHEIARMRSLGCTRVQLGIQHTDDQILSKINRGCTTKDAMKAVQLLKDCGFKIDFHLMPDLPGTTVEKDLAMFNMLLNTSYLQADQWKIYPCQVTPWTVIEKWFKEKKYIPFSNQDLLEVLVDVKSKVSPWIRLNRVIRDIPSSYIIGGNNVTNLREHALAVMKERGLSCKCIRCREARGATSLSQVNAAKLKERIYQSSNGSEHFISFESNDEKTIYGFCRLRITKSAGRDAENKTIILPEILDCALIRELHVYGKVQRVALLEETEDSSRKKNRAQHVGFGRCLMARAEEIARNNGFKRCAVIAGIGAREYYKLLGYQLVGTYMVRDI